MPCVAPLASCPELAMISAQSSAGLGRLFWVGGVGRLTGSFSLSSRAWPCVRGLEKVVKNCRRVHESICSRFWMAGQTELDWVTACRSCGQTHDPRETPSLRILDWDDCAIPLRSATVQFALRIFYSGSCAVTREKSGLFRDPANALEC